MNHTWAAVVSACPGSLFAGPFYPPTSHERGTTNPIRRLRSSRGRRGRGESQNATAARALNPSNLLVGGTSRLCGRRRRRRRFASSGRPCRRCSLPSPSPPLGETGPRGAITKMTKSIRSKKCSSRQLRSHNQRPFCQCNFKRVANQESTLAATEKCAWKDAICPVCLECPHNAVLLLCSSHDKGCRPYICATNYHHSNCLDQLIDSRRSSKDCEDLDSIELACPLCRGEVKGYTLVEPAREQLNRNKRSCMQDGCSYMGSYRELCKHVRKKHPSVKPRSVDPVHTYRWRRLLFRSSLQDMICATSSPMVRRVLYVMLQFEELMASVWHEGDHGAMQIDEMNLADP